MVHGRPRSYCQGKFERLLAIGLRLTQTELTSTFFDLGGARYHGYYQTVERACLPSMEGYSVAAAAGEG